MPIISAYVREDWYYSVKDLQSTFFFNAETYNTLESANSQLKRFIKELLSLSLIHI